MREYFKRLKEHPGVEVATMLCVLGFAAGAGNKSISIWWHGGLMGMLIIGIPVWACVLWSNKK